jgi:2-phosphosulfolactate phosphatase
MEVNIIQGNNHILEKSNINIVIDVIRAFTTSFVAFNQGVSRILLVKETSEALNLKKENVDLLLAGEEDAYPILGFDTDNSPYNMSKLELKNKILVQRTTNGVKATLNSLSADRVFVTGFSNALTLANYIVEKELHRGTINIIASHPTGDDDLAVAEYIKSILFGLTISNIDVIKRIMNSNASKKFFDKNQNYFSEIDIIDFCAKETDADFVMEVDKNSEIPSIKKVLI